MPMPDDELMRLTAAVASAHAAHNSVRSEDLPGLIASIHAAFKNIDAPHAVASDATTQVPAVPIKKSVFPDHIVCLEDGKKLKMLKRHLKTAYSMTPQQYRSKWGLPHDYPMVSPNYSEKRSGLAKKAGLGQIRKSKVSTPTLVPDATATELPVVAIQRKVGRPRKVAAAA